MEEKNLKQILRENRQGYELALETHDRLYGKGNAFLVSKNYRSCYHDDYASFTYYSNATGEYFDDEWTTAFACPAYSCYMTEKTFDEAKEEGLIDVDIYNSEYKIPETALNYDDTLYAFALRCNKAPYVTVISGKKMNGCKGIAIDSYTHYFGGEYYIIYFPEEDKFASISQKSLKLDSAFVDKVNAKWSEAREAELNVNDRLRSLEVSDVIESLYPEDYNDYIRTLRRRWNDIRLGITPNLINWVKEHFTDITDENEIRQIAERIAAKKRNQY